MVFSYGLEKFFHQDKESQVFTLHLMPPKIFSRTPVKFAHQFRLSGSPRLVQIGAAQFFAAWVAGLIAMMADDTRLNTSFLMIAPAAGLGKSGNFRFLCQKFSYFTLRSP
jgi:hypothetical protein